MDKEKVKEAFGETTAKAKAAMSEIKGNFKADEGTTGFRKVQSMFVNLWKSGQSGRIALIASSVVILMCLFLFLFSVLGGGGESGLPDTLVVKGLYMRMPGDDALEACKKLVASSKDLVVVDFRKGFEVEREVGLGEYKKKQEEAYFKHIAARQEAAAKGISADKIDEMGLKMCSKEEWMESHPPSEKEVAASKEKIKEVLNKKNLIQISFKKEGVREDQLKGLCFVWIDDNDNVKEVYFNEDGMARLFNAGDLSGEEFAQSLVDNYPDITSLEPTTNDELKYLDEGSVKVTTSTWIHKNPKGYQVKLFERSACLKSGIMTVDARKAADDSPLNLYLGLAGRKPKKFFTILAIKPESARKFD